MRQSGQSAGSRPPGTPLPQTPTAKASRRLLLRTLAGGLLALRGAAPALAASKAAPAPPPVLQGLVTEVADGSRLTVEVPGQPPLRLRLRDIEVPEACQPGHDESRRALADFALKKSALVQPGNRDAQGRAIATVKVEEIDLSQRMVEEGYAWSVRSKWDQGPLVKQERMAQTLKRGLHATGTLAPAEFRRRHGACPAPAKP
jgi:micrococcal nuclease